MRMPSIFGLGGAPAANVGSIQQEGNKDGVIGKEEDAPEEEESEFSVFADLFPAEDDESDAGDKKDKGDEGDEEDEDEGEKKPKKVKGDSPETTLAKEIQTSLANMSVTEDMIPTDFDSNDPKQLRDLLSKIQRQTALSTIQLAFKPMQLAIANMSKDMRAEIAAAIASSTGTQNAKSILESIVPEAKDPELAGLVKTLHAQAMKKAGVKPADAANAVRKALDAMGVKTKGKTATPSDPSGSAFKTGKDALDMFAPLPVRK